MERNECINTQAFLHQITQEIHFLKWRWRSAKATYRRSKCWKHEQKTKGEFKDIYRKLWWELDEETELDSKADEAGSSPRQQERFYKPQLLRKDECLWEIGQAIRALVAWCKTPSRDFPLYCLGWIEQCFAVLAREGERPKETAADAIRYNWRVVQLVEKAYKENNQATREKRPLPWSEYRLFNEVANLIARYPKEFKSRTFLMNGANSGSIKGPVKNAIADRGASFPSKARNKGRLSKQ